MAQYPFIIDVLCELVYHPFLLAVLASSVSAIPFSASIARNILRVRSVIQAACEAMPPAMEAISMIER